MTDAIVDVRTVDNPLVAGELGLRFYFGVPLTTWDGFNLGTLNVIDVEPREVTNDEVATLSHHALDASRVIDDAVRQYLSEGSGETDFRAPTVRSSRA